MFKKLAACALTAAMFGFGSAAMAHTGVKDQGIEGKSLYTALTIGHGCSHPSIVDASGNQIPLPVVAQSVVFPVGPYDLAYRINPTTLAETKINLANHIVGAIGGVSTLGVKGVQDKSVFQNAKTVKDANLMIRALKLTNGNLDVDMTGVIPFKTSGVKFVPTSCAKSLQVRLAIANWCNTSSTDKRRVDIWIGKMTTKFNDPEVMPHENTEVYWPKLTINRDLVANPLPAACGAGIDIAVQPHPGSIDNFLPIKGFWPAP